MHSRDPFTAAYKAVLRAMADSMVMYGVCAARSCEVYLRMFNDSSSDADGIAKDIEGAKDASTLFEVQWRLGRNSFETASKNWSSAWAACCESQLEMLRRGQAQMARLGEDFRSLNLTESPGDVPGVPTWRSFLETASNAYAVATKTAEEMTGMALAQSAKQEGSSGRRAAP